MAADTITEQVRKAIEGVDANGNTIAKFEVSITVTAKGDLPDDKIFVVSIVDPEDAKEDLFARVATIADFTETTVDRPTAVDTAEDEYRTSTFVLTYDNLETAINAQDVLKSRIDELVNDYRDYLNDFVATPVAEETIHPQYTLDTFNSLVSAYSSAVTAEATAEQTRDDAKDDYDEAVTDAATAATKVTEAQTAWDNCKLAKSWFDDLYTAMASPKFYQEAEALRAAAETYRVATTGTNPTAEATFVTARDTFVGQQAAANKALTTALANQGSFATLCGQMQSDLTTAQAAKATADTAVATKRTAYDDAQTAYENAQQATEAALAAITALKPDFDPETDITS